jgi:hypothetical protein
VIRGLFTECYTVEKSSEEGVGTQAFEYTPHAIVRDEHGHFLKGHTGNRGGRRKPITAILSAYVATPEGRKQVLRAAQKQVRVSAYAPAMATYVRETLEGRLTERLEMSGGLELSARIARARKRLAEADNDTEHIGESE